MPFRAGMWYRATMWGRAMAFLSGLLVAACSVFGIRETEEPPFRVIDRVGMVEVREYGPRLAAETSVGGDELGARSAGFRRLAGYIFGGNQGAARIEMTAPVAQASGGARIAMTAPVGQARDAGGQWTIRFFMPAGYTMETLPAPNDPSVKLVAVPGETVAVLRFSGTPGPTAVAEEQRRLLAALSGSPWRVQGEPVAWFYDPPWTIPPLRRNEAVVPVSR